MSEAGKYIDLEDQVHDGAEYVNTTSFGLGIRYALCWLDAHLDQVPGRTITESEAHDLRKIAQYSDYPGFAGALSMRGVTVAPDSEPTNAEKLEAALLEAWDGHRSMSDVADLLDLKGVTAPEGSQ